MSGPPDVMVIGGGLAGCSMAAMLAAAGRHVVLLEKSRSAHDSVCGEFLSREALHYLDRLGVRVEGSGAVPIRRVRLIRGPRSTTVELPFEARSLSRRVLDEELLSVASEAGAHVQRGAEVRALLQKDSTWTAYLEDGTSFAAQQAVLASGKHDLRGRARQGGRQGGLVAFKMYFRLRREQHAALGDAVELILFPGGYGGLQPVEGGRVNLCLLVTREQLRLCAGRWDTLLRHMTRACTPLAERLDEAVALLPRPLALSHIPYGHVQRHALDDLWRIGDQAAVIPSFCGDGMSIALHSGALAAQAMLRGDPAESFQVQLREQLATRIAGTTALSRLMIQFPAAAELARPFPMLLAGLASITRIPDALLLRQSASHA